MGHRMPARLLGTWIGRWQQRPPTLPSDDQDAPRPRIVGFRDTIPLLRPYRTRLIVAFLVGLAATAASAAQPIVVTSIVDGFAGTFPVVPALLLIALLLASAAFTAVRQLIRLITIHGVAGA